MCVCVIVYMYMSEAPLKRKDRPDPFVASGVDR